MANNLCMNQAHRGAYKVAKEEKVFIQVQASKEEREQLAEIADDRSTSMSSVVRQWIKKAHKAMSQKDKAA